MNTGDMRHRLEIQNPVETPNEFGELVASWDTVAVRWAEIEPLQGRELFAAQQAQANVSHKIRMRYYAGLTPKMRLKKGPRIFNIDGPPLNPGEQARTTEMVVMVKEEV